MTVALIIFIISACVPTIIHGRPTTDQDVRETPEAEDDGVGPTAETNKLYLFEYIVEIINLLLLTEDQDVPANPEGEDDGVGPTFTHMSFKVAKCPK